MFNIEITKGRSRISALLATVVIAASGLSASGSVMAQSNPPVAASAEAPAAASAAPVAASAQAGKAAATESVENPYGIEALWKGSDAVAKTVLLLLIVAVAVHFVMVGMGLYFFGAEGARIPPFTDGGVTLGPAYVQYQTIWIVGIAALLIAGLALFFEHSIYGKALRATAINRTGARLMGISADLAGKLCFTLSALVGAFSGILIAPITTIYYDTGFLVGLKGFVGAIIGGLVSYPLAAAGAVLVGLLESYSSFYASAYKEVIVFTLIIPVLLYQSLTTKHIDDEEDH